MPQAPVIDTPFGPLLVDWSDLERAATRIAGVAHRTPVMTSRTADALTGATLFFKCENLQRMGAFKFRGAYNALEALSAEARARGVLAYSSGNHAQAVALAGRELGVRTTIVMPSDAPAVKLEATRGYGAEVILYDRARESREALSEKLAAERGLSLIPPFDHPEVVAGQGTSAKELFEEVGPLDALLVCCGGGGLLSGCAVAAKQLSPGCRVIGVEPAAGDDATRTFHTGTLHRVDNPDTIADGARTPCLGKVTLPLVMRHVSDMVTVTDAELLAAMFWLWERMKLVVEPTGALAFAALHAAKVALPGARIGVLVSGGNVDLAWAGEVLRSSGATAPR
jgi:threonine dehydratase